MYYFSFIPIELIELIIPYLDTEGLSSFLDSYDVKDLINWTIVYNLHFLQFKNVGYGEYKMFLSIEQLKQKLKLKESVEEIYNLKELDLANNKITEIPKEIGMLINLEELELSYNKITKIPDTMGKLINLQYLSLFGNKIVDLPETFGNLINLQVLNLRNNEIIKIPKSVGNLRNLEYLYLQNNKISITVEKLTNEEMTKLKLLLPHTKIIL